MQVLNDPFSQTETSSDPLSTVEHDIALDPLSDSENIESDSVEAILATVPVHTTVAPAAPTRPTLRARIRGHVRFAFYYCLISVSVFGVLQVATNFVAYSEFALNYINPSRFDISSESMSHQIAKAQVAMQGSDSGVISTGSVARAKILERRFETAGMDDRSRNVLQTIRDSDPYSPASFARSEDVSVDIDIVPYENRIVIPKLNKNIPLVDIDPNSGADLDHLENIFMKELERGVVRYPGTAEPGKIGNAFIFGHSSNYPWVPGEYNQVFALLDKLVLGDEIIVYYRQKKFVYIVQEKEVVKPGNVKSLERDETKAELSLMTCWPLGTSINRLLIFAELQKDESDTLDDTAQTLESPTDKQ